MSPAKPMGKIAYVRMSGENGLFQEGFTKVLVEI